jgi:hypothetical protein
MKKVLPIILAVIISGGIFYYIGTKVGSSSTTPSRQGNFGQFSQNVGANKGGANGFQSGGAVSGSIIGIDSGSIVVQSRDGSSKIVLFSGSTQVLKSISGNLSDLSKGDEVTVLGSVNSDGSITAQSVQIRPTTSSQNSSVQGTTTTINK